MHQKQPPANVACASPGAVGLLDPASGEVLPFPENRKIKSATETTAKSGKNTFFMVSSPVNGSLLSLNRFCDHFPERHMGNCFLLFNIQTQHGSDILPARNLLIVNMGLMQQIFLTSDYLTKPGPILSKFSSFINRSPI
jgi:hypothetical protein